MTDNRAAGAVLRRLRDRRRWSQERAALEADLDHSLVSRIEAGKRSLTPFALERLTIGLTLTTAERDELALAAGLAPVDRASLLTDEPCVVALYRYLRDPSMPARDQRRVREIVRLLVEPWPAAHEGAAADD